MKKLLVFVPLFFLSFLGPAHAENFYDMKYQGFELRQGLGGPGSEEFFAPIPIEQLSNDNLTFSGDASIGFDDPNIYDTSTCCSVFLGNQGSMTVAFDQPVKSVGLDILPFPAWSPSSLYELYDNATVSAVYRNSEGTVIGQNTVTAGWLGSYDNGDWQWNNSYNGHESAFGVSSVSGFTEVTFSVTGGDAGYLFKGLPYSHELNLASTHLYYSYLGRPDVPPVPEPQTYALMMAGLGMLGFTAKRRNKAGSKPA